MRTNSKSEGGLRTKGIYKKTQKERPLITVITVVYNGERYMEQTIQSVINQTYDNIEYIIVDGGSTDNTLKIIKKYENRIDYWISEADSGLWDAMNKGIRLANGEILNFLNSDDYYRTREVIEIVVDDFIRTKCDAWCGNVNMVTIEGQFLYTFRTQLHNPFCCFPHQAFFYKKILHEKYGLYNQSLEYGADYDFYLRLRDKKVNFFCKDYSVTSMRIGGHGQQKPLKVLVHNFYIQVKHDLPFWKAFWQFNFKVLRSSIRVLLENIGLNYAVKKFRKLNWYFINKKSWNK